MSVVSNQSELRSAIGNEATVRGRYVVRDTSPHSVMVELPDGRFKSTTRTVDIVLDDDAIVRLWVRPDDEVATCDGKVVEVRGRIYVDPHGTSMPSAGVEPVPSLVDITDVTVAAT